MSEHPVQQPIKAILWAPENEYRNTWYYVGREGVTRIEACTKSGLHADIPYLRVWQGDECVAEFSQHAVCGVWFDHSDTGADDDRPF